MFKSFSIDYTSFIENKKNTKEISIWQHILK